jgi:hypothetical protein
VLLYADKTLDDMSLSRGSAIPSPGLRCAGRTHGSSRRYNQLPTINDIKVKAPLMGQSNFLTLILRQFQTEWYRLSLPGAQSARRVFAFPLYLWPFYPNLTLQFF